MMDVLVTRAGRTEVDTGDTAWMLTATALVLFMTIGLGLFYAGLVRAKNALNTFMMCIAAIAIAGVTWALVGYSLAFDGTGDLIGGLNYVGTERRDVRAARRHDDPAPGLLRLPGDLLHHHDRAGVGRRRGADAVRRVHDLRRAVVGARLLGDGALGLRRRLADRGRHARLRRRRAGRDGVRLLRAGGRARGRRAQGLRPAGPAAAQRGVSCCSAPGCCGSAGSASTAAAASRPATPACSRSRTRC